MTQSTAFKTEWDKLFIGGKWVEPSTDEVIEVRSPATGEYVGRVPRAAAADVDAAVAAARKAFDEGPWPSTPPAERAAVLQAAVKLLEDRKDYFTHVLTAELGQPGLGQPQRCNRQMAIATYPLSRRAEADAEPGRRSGRRGQDPNRRTRGQSKAPRTGWSAAPYLIS